MSFNDGFNDSMQRILVDGRADLNVDFWREVKLSAPGARYFADYVSPTNNLKMIEAAFQLHPDAEHITVSIAVDSIATLLAAGELVAVRQPEPTPVAQAPVPTDRNGRPLSAAQIAWSAMSRWSDSASMDQIRERKRIDPIYAQFVRTNFEREMQVPIDGDNRNVPNPGLEAQVAPSTAALADSRLVAFAAEYRVTPASKVRLLKQVGSNPGTAGQYIRDEEDCYRLGLL